MSVKEKRMCQLCFNTTESDFVVIGDNIKEMFDVLLLKLNLDISKQKSVICKNCAEVIIKSFNFKSKCIRMQELVVSVGVDKEECKFELRDLYDENAFKTSTEEFGICRLCLNQKEMSNFVPLDFLKNELISVEMLMPQIDFSPIKNSPICIGCRDNLQGYIKFASNYLNIEKIEIKEECVAEENVTNYDSLVNVENVKQELDEHLAENSEKNIIYMKMNIDTMHTNYSDYTTKIEKNFETDKHISKVEYDTGLSNDTICMKNEIKSTNVIHNHEIEENIYKCTLCTYQTKYKSRFNTHVLHHKFETRKYRCEKCSHQTKYKKNLRRHLLIHKNPSELEMYRCNICTYETKHKPCLQNHMINHKDVSEIEMQKCDVCPYVTKYRKNLLQHQLMHKELSDEKSMYKCQNCSYETKQKEYLKKHVRVHKLIPDPEKIYACDVCSYKTTNKVYIRSHLLRHKDVKDTEFYKCESCDYETKYKSHLSVHSLKHKDVSEVQMYQCAVCQYETRYKKDLKRHTLIHNKAVKMYKCSECYFETEHSGGLKWHTKVIHKAKQSTC